MGKGKGTIVPLEDKPNNKCRKWQLRVSAGLNPSTGKYRTRTHRVTGTYSQAQKALRDFVNEVEHEEHIGREKITLDDAIALYLEQRALEVRESTVKSYTNYMKSVTMHLGKMDVRKINKRMVEDMRTALLRGDTRSGAPMSTATVYEVVKTLSKFFDWAVKRGYADQNPTLDLTPIKVTHKEKHALASEDLSAFAASLDLTDAHELALALYATMGLRRAEALGITWNDVDLKDRTILIRQAKSKAGVRRLPMPERIFDGIRKRRTAQREHLAEMSERLSITIEQTGDTPIIDNGIGKPISPSRMGNWWRHHAKDYGLEDYTLHELRHSYITALAISGVQPGVAKELAGHASITTTMDIYTHVNMDAKRAAVDLFEGSNPLGEKE